MTMMEELATEFPVFECLSSQHLLATTKPEPSESVLNVTDTDVEYKPSEEQLQEDTRAVEEISSRVYAELKKSATEITDVSLDIIHV